LEQFVPRGGELGFLEIVKFVRFNLPLLVAVDFEREAENQVFRHPVLVSIRDYTHRAAVAVACTVPPVVHVVHNCVGSA